MQEAATTSLWHDTLDGPIVTDGPLEGPAEADVAIVGAGYTGLWTAYYLALADPTRRIVVIDAREPGFGASGRNGGWCSALMPMSLDALADRHGRAAAIDMQVAMHDTVDEVRRVAETEAIECGMSDGGYVQLARSAPQVRRVRDHLAHMSSFGFGEDHHRWLDADEACALVGADGVEGAAFTPHCAALHPARLVAGLTRAVRARGVQVHGDTAARRIAPREVVTDRGLLRARHVIRATEAWTSTLPGSRRATVPLYSLMIATEPLDDWSGIGLDTRATFNDARHLIVYGQRTSDDRLAFGGRGAPYHFGSAIRPEFDLDGGVHRALRDALVELFPVLRDVRITHRWGGPLGVPRDWHASVGLDPASGIGWAGGYIGDGVATTNLAGRTLAALIDGVDSPLVRLPWVGHRSRRWEPEPLRSLAIGTALRLPATIDAHEQRTGRSARWREWVLDSLTGH